MTVEIRVSPDEQSVAIRRDTPEDAYNAWAVMNREHGGHVAPSTEVEDWDQPAANLEPGVPAKIRVAPDHQSVAIRRDVPAGAYNEWGVMHRADGGRYAPNTELEGWEQLR